jgi:hypothetical protein
MDLATPGEPPPNNEFIQRIQVKWGNKFKNLKKKETWIFIHFKY